MTEDSKDLYALEPGTEFRVLDTLDFADVMWQAFDVNKFESITIEATRVKDKIKVRILAMRPTSRKKKAKRS
jgi:hypothetical protein